ncbi:MAG: efflux RND transporter permease subunit [Planctomycetota bacterium]
MDATNREQRPRGLIARIVETFLGGRLSIILVVSALALGVAAILITPREEDPQIVVPMADIYVEAPGASPEEIEQLVTTPLERYLYQVDGVEYVYSISRRDMAVVTVRFYVGEDREDSLVKLHNRILMHRDRAPPLVSGWVTKPVEIDDVPIVTITLHSQTHDDYALRRIGEEAMARLDQIRDVSRTRIVGGRERVVRVTPDPEAMEARGVDLLTLQRAIAAADANLSVGSFDRADRRSEVTAGPFITGVDDVDDLVVGVHRGAPVYLADVASVTDGPAEPSSYTRIGKPGWDETRSAVTLAVAKKQGTNAVAVADEVIAAMAELEAEVLPAEVAWDVTRNYGQTADAKVNELLSSLGFAMVTVIGLLLFTLGWREGLVVAIAVPISFALALFVNYAAGYTINRVTLFALILTLGLVVDDPITNVDNIQRHMLMRKRSPFVATLWAVQEVLPPVIMSTLAIIVSFLPMFFITGMMGPYMQPMAVNVPMTVIFSTVAALSVVPWAAYHLIKGKVAQNTAEDGADAAQDVRRTKLYRIYAPVVAPFLARRWLRWTMLGAIVMLLGLCGLLVILRQVPMKMLPFDNKNELQLIVDMPEGATLERTDAVIRDFEREIATVNEVVDYTSYVGTFSPIDFNGLVRHYYFRREANVADIRINLVDKDRRAQQSHEIGLRIRDRLEAIAETHGARIAIVEIPPGPPVIATVTAEIYGPPDAPYDALIAGARTVRERFAAHPGLSDTDVSAVAPHMRWEFRLDKEKAALHGIRTADAVAVQLAALGGVEPATVHTPDERNPLHIRLRLDRNERSGIPELQRLRVAAADGTLVPLAEIGSFVEVPQDQPIYHKNLRRVAYAFAECVGTAPDEVVLDLARWFEEHPLEAGATIEWAGEGEWKITLRVFRDLGLAFGAAMVGIYILLVIQTGSFVMPLVVMTAIPLTAIGILPGFWLLNLIADNPVGGYATPVFFTATAMIGMIALGGIVVRNAIVLIEFIQDSQEEGMSLKDAILASGAVRMRPILLTAATTALGAWPITLDPIFSGLAWALIFGLFASTTFTLLVVPVVYFMVYGPRAAAAGEGT